MVLQHVRGEDGPAAEHHEGHDRCPNGQGVAARPSHRMRRVEWAGETGTAERLRPLCYLVPVGSRGGAVVGHQAE